MADKPTAHIIPAAFLKLANRRKKEKGISIKRSIEDALKYAMANKEQWTK